jgi:tetratricopeptide (TPR) repeat protein
MKTATIAATVALLLVLSGGCGGDNNPTAADLAARYTAQGWDAFEVGDYSGALVKFDEALDQLSEYIPALEGRGWALAFLGEFAEARLEFVLARELSGTNRVATWAGGAFSHAALEQWDQVVEWAESAISLDATWQFSHAPDIRVTHLRYILATAYWYRGSYEQCGGQLDILEPGVVHDLDPQALLADLQRLYISPFD